MTDHGTVSYFTDDATVRFDRTIAAPIERVWSAITTPSELAEWLAPCELEAREGGRVRVEFAEDQVVTGVVTVCEPPHRLEYTWTFTGEPDSVLGFELTSIGDDTRLVLIHRRLPSEQAAGYGAGWHAHLDSLAARATGSEPIDWDERFSEVLGHYAGA